MIRIKFWLKWVLKISIIKLTSAWDKVRDTVQSRVWFGLVKFGLVLWHINQCRLFYSSNWGQKSKTWVSYWWSCISLVAHVFSVKDKRTHSPTIHSPTWKLKQNKRTRKCSKKGNTPRKWWFKSNQFQRIHLLTSFCLASDPQRKNVSLACWSIWKRPNSRQPVFRSEVPPAPSTRKRPVREAKFNLKNYTGWNANSYINRLFNFTSVYPRSQ